MKFVYPEGKKKALTFSYDDGQIYDERVVDIFNRHGLKGTFHLNSDNLYLERADYVSAARVKELYEGQEVACHGRQHRCPSILGTGQKVGEIIRDRIQLEQLTGSRVQGYSYAFGIFSAEDKEALKYQGIHYARTVRNSNNFFVPGDFMEWNPTCHHNDSLGMAEKFLNAPGYVELPLMYVWGHSFEFERNRNWELLEELADKLSGREEIWYATNEQIYEYLTAIRRLESTADGTKLYNPSAKTVWYEKDGVLCSLPGGEESTLINNDEQGISSTMI